MQRLVSLDVLRGITVAAMILVNDGYGETFPALKHVAWNGMTPCDLVFSTFLFIVGISTYLSLSKLQFQPTGAVLTKVIRRTVIIFLLGLFINWLVLAVDGRPGDFAHLRYWAVLQRIAVCYLAVSLFALFVPHRHTVRVIIGLLVAYAAILLLGNGYSEDGTLNIAGRIDTFLFGKEHLYQWAPIDPEGLLGCLGGIAHTLIGFQCARLMMGVADVRSKVFRLLMAGGGMVLVAFFLHHFGLPFNKTIWSPSYALMTCGLAAVAQGLFMYIIDIRGWQRWTVPFLIFGVNPLFLYVFSECLAVFGWQFGANDALYAAIHSIVTWPELASLCFALTYVLVCALIGYILYSRRIFIKI